MTGPLCALTKKRMELVEVKFFHYSVSSHFCVFA